MTNPSSLEAIDNLMQCAATDFAGMDYPSLKKLATESAVPVTEVLAAWGELEKTKEGLLRGEQALDSEKE